MSNLYGNNIKLRIFGGSHDDLIGMEMSSFPRSVELSADDLQAFMNRRAPGNNSWSTKRKESDVPELESGVDEKMIDGKVIYVTNGDVLRAVIHNTNQHSRDYSNTVTVPRPSHADYPAMIKFGKSVDLRGGGKYSGRLTAPLCIAGAFCLAYLKSLGITVGAHILQIGDVKDTTFDSVSIDSSRLNAISSLQFPLLDESVADDMKNVIESARLDGDSVGGIIECAVVGLPVGIGNHPFDGLEGRISSIIFSIPAVKAIEFGDGFEIAKRRGSENNDAFFTDGKNVSTVTNHCGGILGGMSNGMPLVFRAAIKPTPSISKEQNSVDIATMQNTKLQIVGRHDPCIVPRAVPVFEAAAAVAIVDSIFDDICEE